MNDLYDEGASQDEESMQIGQELLCLTFSTNSFETQSILGVVPICKLNKECAYPSSAVEPFSASATLLAGSSIGNSPKEADKSVTEVALSQGNFDRSKTNSPIVIQKD